MHCQLAEEYRSTGILAAMLSLAACGAPLAAQIRDKVPEKAAFRVDSQMVLVSATVMDRKGMPVTGLRADSFSLTQDNAPRPIVSFGEEDVPVPVGIVLDTSGSMLPVLGMAKDMLRAFVEASNPEDESSLFTVGSQPEKISGFTGDTESLVGKTLFHDAGGATALVDTVYSALNQMRQAKRSRKAILVISDGMDNHSRYSVSELMAAAVESDLQIYSITVYDPPRNKKPIEL